MHLAVDASRGRLRSIVAVTLILTMAFIVPMRPTSAATAPVTGIMIPLYTYPGASWSTVVAIKQANPNVPIIAIINPNSGPGASLDPTYVAGIKSLQAAGVIVIGYVPTGYTARSASQVQAMVMDYKNWYPVTGIFFDEMANTAGSESYYSALSSFAKSVGFTYTVGNPGADTIPSYIGTMDTIVIYENQGLPVTSTIGGWHTSYAKSNFAMMAYGVPAVDPAYPTTTSQYVGYIYITDEGLPNPYNGLPGYLSAVASQLVSATAATTTTSTATATTTATATATTTTTSTATAVTTVTSTATVTGTATATTTTTSTATAMTTATATTTTTATATKTANVTTTNTATAMTTSTGTATATTTVTSTATAITTTTSTATATTTTTVAPPPASVPTTSVAPAAYQDDSPSTNPAPSAVSGPLAAVANAVAAFGNFLSAEARLFGGLIAHAVATISQDLRLALSLP
jgi:hypothetical protein